MSRQEKKVTEYHRGRCGDPSGNATFRDNSAEGWEVECNLVEGSYDEQHNVYEALWLCGFASAYRAEYHSPKKGVLIERTIGSTERYDANNTIEYPPK